MWFCVHENLSQEFHNNVHIESEYCSLTSAVDCGSLPDPENGRVEAPSGTTYNNTFQYSCYAGYMLIGEEMRTCQSNLSWTLTAPYCVGTPI